MTIDENCTTELQLGEPKHSIGLRIYSILAATSLLTIVVVSLICWVAKRKEFVYLKKRNLYSILMLSLAQVITVNAGLMQRTFPRANTYIPTCVGHNFTFISIVPLIVIANLNTILTFKWRAEYSAALASEDIDFEMSKWLEISSKSYFPLLLAVVTFFFWLALSVSVSVFQCSNECTLLSFNDNVTAIILFGFFFIGLAQTFYIKRQLKTYPDPFGIIREIAKAYKYTFWLAIILIPFGILLNALYIGEIDPADREREIKINGTVFSELSIFFIYFYLVPYQIYKAIKFEQSSEELEGFSLDDILRDKVGHDLLKKHLMFEFSVENILFLDAVKDLRISRDKSEAIEIYKKYIKTGTISLPLHIVTILKEKYMNGSLDHLSYEEAYDAIVVLIQFDSLYRFKESHDFKVYVGFQSKEFLNE